MEILIANLVGKTRKETLFNREYLVAPLTMIVEGVLNGSEGPLFYPKEEIAANFEAWNGMPLVVYHPQENGRNVSARHPRVLNKYAVGNVYNARFDGDKLHAEAWFDLEPLKRVDNRVYDALINGQAIELSTGLYTDKERVNNGAAWQGKPYTFVARRYRPDHLAVLPDQQGACSLNDGCGIMVNQEKTTLQNIIAGLNRLIGLTDNGGPGSGNFGHAGIPGQQGGSASGSGGSPTHGAAKAGATGKDRIAKIFGDVEVSHDEDGADLILKVINPSGKAPLSIPIKNRADSQQSADESITVVNDDTTLIEETSAMAKLNAEQKKKIVDGLCTNCSCKVANVFTEEDRPTLEAMTDERLLALNNMRAVTAHSELVVNAAKEIVGNEVAINEMPAALKAAMKRKEGMKEEEEEEVIPPKTNAEKTPKVLTDAEWLKSAPSGIQSAVRNAMAIESREKNTIIAQLTANVSDDDKERVVNRLKGKDLEELRDLQAMLPVPVENYEQHSEPSPNYAGLGYSPTANRSADKYDKNDILPLPTINWNEKEESAAV